KPAWLLTVANQAARSGLILVLFSATPLPYWLYGVTFVSTIGWLVVENAKSEAWRTRRRWWRVGVAAGWLCAIALALPYHFTPRLPPLHQPTLYIVADSVTAGLSESDDTWPRILVRERQIEVQDFSRPGATAASALNQAQKLPAEGGLVLLEIGGNDLLG